MEMSISRKNIILEKLKELREQEDKEFDKIKRKSKRASRKVR